MMQQPVSAIFGRKDIKGVVSVAPSTTISEAVAVMCNNGIGAVVVTDAKGDVAGIFTERDVMQRVVGEGRDARATAVEAVMSREVRRVPSTAPMNEALRLMVEHNYRHLVVEDEGQVRGVLSIRDLMGWAILTDAPPHEGRPGVLKARADDALEALRGRA